MNVIHTWRRLVGISAVVLAIFVLATTNGPSVSADAAEQVVFSGVGFATEGRLARSSWVLDLVQCRREWTIRRGQRMQRVNVRVFSAYNCTRGWLDHREPGWDVHDDRIIEETRSPGGGA